MQEAQKAHFSSFRLSGGSPDPRQQRELHPGLGQQDLRPGRLQAARLLLADDLEELPRRGRGHQLCQQRGRASPHQRLRPEEDQRKDPGLDQEWRLVGPHQVITYAHSILIYATNSVLALTR